MPLMLALTLKAAKNKKPLPKIPQKPMFHDDPYLEEDIEENNEDNVDQHTEENNDVQAKPSTSRTIFVKPAPEAESHMYCKCKQFPFRCFLKLRIVSNSIVTEHQALIIA